eukprot:9502208-Pyramimonas_sp.AAC.1
MGLATGMTTTTPTQSSTVLKPKPPKLTACDIFGTHVDTYIKSVQLYVRIFSLTDEKEIAMVYVNNLTEASKAHLYNLHPLSNTAFYESSTEVISFLQQYTYESDKMAHALSSLRNLSMKGLKLKTYYTAFCKHLASCGWTPNSQEAIHFFIQGINPDSLPNNLQLTLQDKMHEPHHAVVVFKK